MIHIPLAVLPQGGRSFDENLHALLDRKRRLTQEALLPPEADDAERRRLLDEVLKQSRFTAPRPARLGHLPSIPHART